MEAIRKVITVKDSLPEFMLPNELRNRKLEVIILPAKDETSNDKSESFDFNTLYGTLHSGLSVEQIDQQLKTLRDEWNRNI